MAHVPSLSRAISISASMEAIAAQSMLSTYVIGKYSGRSLETGCQLQSKPASLPVIFSK